MSFNYINCLLFKLVLFTCLFNLVFALFFYLVFRFLLVLLSGF